MANREAVEEIYFTLIINRINETEINKNDIIKKIFMAQCGGEMFMGTLRQPNNMSIIHTLCHNMTTVIVISLQSHLLINGKPYFGLYLSVGGDLKLIHIAIFVILDTHLQLSEVKHII